MRCDSFDICLLEGLDDLAHNRLLTPNKKLTKFTKVKNYGKRNKKEKCYCKEIKKLRLRTLNRKSNGK